MQVSSRLSARRWGNWVLAESPGSVAGVILAGGRSRRMGGVAKAFLDLSGTPLLQHVINRVRPQVAELFLSVEIESADFTAFGLRQVADPNPGSQGPLGGLLGAMEAVANEGREWLLLAPCDAPFLPLDLAARLKDRAAASRRPGAVVSLQGELQPTFSLWHCSLLPKINAAVREQGMAGFKQYLRHDPLATLEWPADDKPDFLNINDPATLDAARRILDRRGNTEICSA